MDVALARRRALRRNSTDAEVVLWSQLRAKRFLGAKIRRQHPCGPYILDFYCPSARLAIELDGGQHYQPAVQHYDERRMAYLRREGIRTLRFPCNLVFIELAAVLEVIRQALDGHPSR